MLDSRIVLSVSVLVAAAVIALPQLRREAPIERETRRSETVSRSGLSVREEPIYPVPDRPDIDPALLELGHDLFHDTRLSPDNSIACGTCHVVANGGDDDRRFAVGIEGQTGERNSPTVLNASLNFRQFWDGRAGDLAEQAQGPLFAANEMGWDSWDSLLAHLRSQADLVPRFEEVFGEGPTSENVILAIVTFEEWLLTPDAPFDRWLKGEDDALSEDALAGYERFKELGCIACHQGQNVGGSMFQRVGRVAPTSFEGEEGHRGRFDQTGNDRDLHRFKVPSLRNVARTAPYLHDGSIATLAEAIQYMAEYQLGTSLSERDVELVEAFLSSLNGELPPLEALAR